MIGSFLRYSMNSMSIENGGEGQENFDVCHISKVQGDPYQTQNFVSRETLFLDILDCFISTPEHF